MRVAADNGSIVIDAGWRKGVETTRMRTGVLRTACALAAMALAALPGMASANMLMLHAQGDPGDRELFFTNLMMADRTPMDAMLGSTSIREIEVFGLYENAGKPDWTVLKLQFECPADPLPSAKPRRATGLAVAAPLRWRMGERSYQFTRDADNVPLPPTPWQSLSNPAYRKAGVLACNELLARSALHAAGGWEAMDPVKLNAGLAPLGIGEVISVAQATSIVTVGSFVWRDIWKAQKPAGARDRRLSDAEMAKNRRELAAVGAKMETLDAQAQAFAQPILDADRAEQEFLAIARKVQAGRKVTELEGSMLMVWLGKPEALALARLGANPQVTEASGMRFISYSDQADTRSAVVSAASGRVLSQSGAYTSCDVSFVTVPDKTQAWRVADIRIRSEGPAGGMCRALLNTPEN
ncbi:hypothetical protein FB548_2913 [Pseudoxanthomonas sp. 3HH-4]|nr:hypothetical protein FB548_2913 [Pseudoxanthomonas sp. 3HH-4]